MKTRVFSLVTEPFALLTCILCFASCGPGSVTILPENPSPGEVVVVRLSAQLQDTETPTARVGDQPAKVLGTMDARHVRVMVPSVAPGTYQLEIRVADRVVGRGKLKARASASRRYSISVSGNTVALTGAAASSEPWSGHADMRRRRIAVDVIGKDETLLFSTTLQDPATDPSEILVQDRGSQTLSISRGRLPATLGFAVTLPELGDARAIRVYRVPPGVDATLPESRQSMTLLGELPAREQR